jgi:glutamyl-tRNA(Gln) amidotransferase subunit E
MREALVGVPRETRKSLPSGATCFERMLPGPDRMYPDTDLPPIVLDDAQFDRARGSQPEPLWEKEERYASMGLSKVQIGRLFTEDAFATFEALNGRACLRPTVLAYLLLDWVPFLKRRGKDVSALTLERYGRLFPAGETAVLDQKVAAARVAGAVGHRPKFLSKPDPRAMAEGRARA